MQPLPPPHDPTSNDSPQFKSLLYLFAVILLLSTITPLIKVVFQQSAVHPITLAWYRVMLGFVFLMSLAWLWDRKGIASLAITDLGRLSLLGVLGVVSYSVAAWGLLYTSVTHYILIYSLIPTLTAIFGFVRGNDSLNPLKLTGIVCSLVGCVLAISESFQEPHSRFGYGDGLVLLFTIMMAAYLALSTGIVKRLGALPANAVMFGSSSLLLFVATIVWKQPPGQGLSLTTGALVVYIGAATAAVFLFRYLALRTLAPTSVATYHTLIPVCTIFLAHLYLGETVGVRTILGGGLVVAGAEIVRRSSSASTALKQTRILSRLAKWTLGASP